MSIASRVRMTFSWVDISVLFGVIANKSIDTEKSRNKENDDDK